MQFLSPGDLSNPEMELASLLSPALAGGFFTTEPLGKPSKEYIPGFLVGDVLCASM